MAIERNCETIGYKSAKYRSKSATIQNLKFENFGKFSFFAKGTVLALKLSVFGFGQDKNILAANEVLRNTIGHKSAIYRPKSPTIQI